MESECNVACSAIMLTSIDAPEALKRNARGQARSSTFLAAVIRSGRNQTAVKIRNMSPIGALLQTVLSPAVTADMNLVRGALSAKCTVVWSTATHCGVRFDAEVKVKDWLASTAKTGQREVDEIVAQVRAGVEEVLKEKPFPNGPRLQGELADDLAIILELMQDLELDLASSDETLQRHASKLQNLDIAMQMLRAVAGESSEGDQGQAAGARLNDLRVASKQAQSS